MTLHRFLLLFVITLVPSPLFSNTLYFPQVAFGGGYSTTFVIVNTGSTAVSSRLNIYDQTGNNRSSLSTTISLNPKGSSRFTIPNTGPLTVGWAEFAADAGTVEGTATLDLRTDNGRLITTADTRGVEAGNTFVLPVDTTSTTNTGVAIANVTDSIPVNATLRLLREDGSEMAVANDVRLGSLGPRRQIADYVTGLFPELAGTTFKGSLVVEAATGAPANPLAATVIAEREGSLSALPVLSRSAADGPTTGNTIYFPQVAFGGGYSTTFVILNTGTTNVSSRLNFHDQNGVIRLENSAALNIPAGGSTRFTIPNTGPLTVGWADFAALPGAVKGMAIFDRRAESGELIATTSVPGVESANTFLLPVELSPTASTGIAIANVKDDAPVNVNLRFLTENGVQLTVANDLRLNPLLSWRQIANFMTTLFPLLRGATFKGTLLVEAAAGAPANSLAATAVAMKERGSNDGPTFALTALPRDLTPAEQKIVEASNAFSLGLWSKINEAEPSKNVFVSPLSASFALGMAMNGAATQTYEEMRSALQFGGATDQEINEGYRSLVSLLGGLDPGVKMQIANSIWYRNTFPFLQSFLDTGKQYFDAEVAGLDFTDVPGTVARINGWVDSKTNHKIPTILRDEDINSDSVMVLVNAIYFNGNWRDKFNPADTRDALFNAAGGSSQTMSLMRRRGMMSYVESPTYQAVDLPYGNSAFTMTVVLPKLGTDVESVAASLTPATWQALANEFRVRQGSPVDVDLSLPKLRLEYERTLNKDLQALGMKTAFVIGGADFTRMSPAGKGLGIAFVRQKTFVDVHEEGTEAAAVTAVGVVQVCACPPPEPKIMRVDRPYIFAIRERLSGTLLFMGKIVRMPQ